MARRPGSADKPSPPGANDVLLWRRVQESAKPLIRRKPAPVFPPPEPAGRDAPAARASRATPRPVGPPLSGTAPPPLSPGAAPGLDRSTHDKLRRGQLPIEGKLDLHGMDRERAHRALDQFLERAAAQGRRCMLVVTGKGGKKPGEPGVLRSEVPRWLNEPPHRARLLAFCPAQPRHGGAGALYLLLKRRREP